MAHEETKVQGVTLKEAMDAVQLAQEHSNHRIRVGRNGRPQTVLLSGWAEKLVQKYQIFHPRFFILTEFELLWYQDEPNKEQRLFPEPEKACPLSEVARTRQLRAGERQFLLKGDGNYVVIEHPPSEILLNFSSSEKAMHWSTLLRGACARLRTTMPFVSSLLSTSQLMDEEEATSCAVCHAKFSMLNWRKLCGTCGSAVCGRCLPYKLMAVKVCTLCFVYSQNGDVDPQPLEAAAKPEDPPVEEPPDLLTTYIDSLDRGAPVAAVVRSMKQNGLSKADAARFVSGRGEVAQSAFQQFFDNSPSTSRGARDTLMVQIEPIFLDQNTRRGTIFDTNAVTDVSGFSADSVLMQAELADIRQAFAAKQPKERKERKSSDKAAPSQPGLVQILDVQRAQNVMVALRRFKEFGGLRDILFAVGERHPAMDPTAVQLLLSTLPKPNEVKMLAKYQGPPEHLRIAEQWMVLVTSNGREVQNTSDKLRTLLLSTTLQARIERCAARATAVHATCVQIQQSRRLKRMLEVILTVCNALNRNTRLGGASGLSFTSLLKLTHTRSSTGNRRTVLDYVVKFLVDRGESDVCDLAAELPALKRACRLDEQHIYVEFQGITRDLQVMAAGIPPLIQAPQREEAASSIDEPPPPGSPSLAAPSLLGGDGRAGLLAGIAKVAKKKQREREKHAVATAGEASWLVFRDAATQVKWSKRMTECQAACGSRVTALQPLVLAMTEESQELAQYFCEEYSTEFQTSLFAVLQQFVDAVALARRRFMRPALVHAHVEESKGFATVGESVATWFGPGVLQAHRMVDDTYVVNLSWGRAFLTAEALASHGDTVEVPPFGKAVVADIRKEDGIHELKLHGCDAHAFVTPWAVSRVLPARRAQPRRATEPVVEAHMSEAISAHASGQDDAEFGPPPPALLSDAHVSRQPSIRGFGSIRSLGAEMAPVDSCSSASSPITVRHSRESDGGISRPAGESKVAEDVEEEITEIETC